MYCRNVPTRHQAYHRDPVSEPRMPRRELALQYHENSVVWFYNDECLYTALNYLVPAVVYAAA